MALGRRLVDERYEVSGSANSPTRPERCAYYAQAKLTKKDVARFTAKDGEAFGLAFMFNESAILSAESRSAFEQHAHFSHELYRTRQQGIARKRPLLRDVLVPREADEGTASVPGAANIARLEAQIADLHKQLRNAGWLIVVGFIMLAWLLRH